MNPPISTFSMNRGIRPPASCSRHPFQFHLVVALLLWTVLPAARAQETTGDGRVNDLPRPATFTDFKDAIAHAKETGKIIFIACTKKNDPDSFKFAKLVEENAIYLAAGKVTVYAYEVEDDARLASFKSHFKVSSGASPIAVIADSWGKPLGHKTGLVEPDAYVAFVKEVAGDEAIEIPPEGMFGMRKGDLIGSVDLTEMRTWTKVSGQKFTAALTEARGSTGVFRSDGGETLEVGFNLLSPPDIEYLKSTKVLEAK